MATTILDDALTQAIAAHDEWRGRLRMMIVNGATTADARDVRGPDECDFGKWLQSRKAAGNAPPRAKTIAELHARLHEATARVLELVDARRRAEALQALAPDGEFTLASAEFAKAVSESSVAT
jgi:hypothetical protein